MVEVRSRLVVKDDPYSTRDVPLAVMVRLPISPNAASYTTNSGAVLVGFTWALAKMQKGCVKKEAASKSSTATGDWKFPVDAEYATSESPAADVLVPWQNGSGVRNAVGAAETQFCRRSVEKNGVMQDRAPKTRVHAYLERHRFVRRQSETATEVPRVARVT